MDRYDSIIKPKWAPPAWIFAPAWTILYSLLLVSFIWLAAIDAPAFILSLFVLNIILNLSYVGASRNLRAGSIIIALTLATAIWFALVVRKVSPVLFYLQIPYILWLCFALALQLSLKEKKE